jgi:hypothetical protein
MPAKSKKQKTDKREQCGNLYLSILSYSVKMDKCSSCESSGAECFFAEGESSRCSACVIGQKSLCDARQLSPSQFRKVAAQHIKLEAEIEAAEEEHKRELERLRQSSEKVERLRKQKKMWYRKMMRAVARGIDDLDELDKVERAEAEASRQAETSLPNPIDSEVPQSSVDAVDWDQFDVDPSLLTFLGSIGDENRQSMPSHVQGSQ